MEQSPLQLLQHMADLILRYIRSGHRLFEPRLNQLQNGGDEPLNRESMLLEDLSEGVLVIHKPDKIWDRDAEDPRYICQRERELAVRSEGWVRGLTLMGRALAFSRYLEPLQGHH